MPDAERILEYLEQGNSITFNDCQRLFGSNSLRERVRDLRRRGTPILTRKEQNPTTKRYHAVYSLKGTANVQQDLDNRELSEGPGTAVYADRDASMQPADSLQPAV